MTAISTLYDGGDRSKRQADSRSQTRKECIFDMLHPEYHVILK